MMINKTRVRTAICSTLIVGFSVQAQAATSNKPVVPPSPNGIEFPENYRDWRVISVSHRTDHHSMRAILGNDIAIQATRSNNTNPWPDGTVLAKVVWQEGPEENWPSAIAPKTFIHVEFMFKDAEKWSDTGGWGYARWIGDELEPYGSDIGFTQECVACHTPVKRRDWVYTTPALMPALPKNNKD